MAKYYLRPQLPAKTKDGAIILPAWVRFKYASSRPGRAAACTQINVRWLAKACGVTRVTMSNILNGKWEPKFKTLKMMARELGMDIVTCDEWLQQVKEGRFRRGSVEGREAEEGSGNKGVDVGRIEFIDEE